MTTTQKRLSPRTRARAKTLLERYQADPACFAKEALGVTVWSRQRDVLRAVAAHPRVAVRSGHKVGKSTSAAILALWWICTRKRGRVIMTSATYRQVKAILWRELRRILREAPVRIGGKLADDPETGLQLADGREILGFSTKDPEKMAGISGPELLFILDEASGIPEPIFEAIEGNRAGGASVVMFSNPTQSSGTFFDAFHNSRQFWHTISISSAETPNVVEGRPIIPGLATRDWIEEKKKEWGVDSALYQVRVAGNFPKQGDNAVISLHLVTEAVERWADAPDEDGPLELGLDVAEFGDDDSVLIARRGRKAWAAETWNGLDAVQLVGKVLAYIRDIRADGEIAVVKVDVVGVGAGVASLLATHRDEVKVVRVNASATPTADEEVAGKLKNLRAQLWVGMRDWLKAGGAIPEDGKLEGELVAPTYLFDAQGRMQIESKKDMRKRLGRSPDRADALGLAIFSTADQEHWIV